MAADLNSNMAAQLRETYNEMSAEDLLHLRAQGTLTETAEAVLQEVLQTKGMDPDKARTIEEGFRREVLVNAAAALRLPSVGRRLTAHILDMFVTIVGLFVVTIAMEKLSPAGRDTNSMICVSLAVLYLLFKDGIGGRSIGKLMMDMKVVSYKDGRACGLLQSAVRNVSSLLGILDSIFALGKQRRRLGDLLAGTQVINSRVSVTL
jgi:uncharacterized RDD family membrane protein YckC